MERIERGAFVPHIARAGPSSIRRLKKSSEPDSKLKSVFTFASSTVSSNTLSKTMWSFFKKAFTGPLSSNKKSRRTKAINKIDISQPRPSEETTLLTKDQSASPSKRDSGVSCRSRAPPAARIETAGMPVTRIATRQSVQVFPPQRNRNTFVPAARFVLESEQAPQHYTEKPAVVLVNDRSGKLCAGIALSLDLSYAMQGALMARRDLLLLERTTERQRDELFAREKQIIEQMRSLSRELSRLRLEDADNVDCIAAVKQDIRDNERQHNALLKRNDSLERELVEMMKEQNRLQEKIDEVLDATFVEAKLLDAKAEYDVLEEEPELGHDAPPEDYDVEMPVVLEVDDGMYAEQQSEITNPYPEEEIMVDGFDGDHTYQDEVANLGDANDDQIIEEFYYDDRSRILAWQENIPLAPADAGAEEGEGDDDRVTDEWDVESVGMASINGIALGATRFRIDTYERINVMIREQLEED